MGTLLYGGLEVDIEDRALAHLQIVIVRRFRRGEPLTLSWIDALSVGNGRSSLWLHPAHPVSFRFSGARPPAIDRDWLGALAASAESSGGLVLMDETGGLVRAQGLRRPR